MECNPKSGDQPIVGKLKTMTQKKLWRAIMRHLMIILIISYWRWDPEECLECKLCCVPWSEVCVIRGWNSITRLQLVRVTNSFSEGVGLPTRGEGVQWYGVTKIGLTPSILKLQQSVLPFCNPQDQGYPDNPDNRPNNRVFGSVIGYGSVIWWA